MSVHIKEDLRGRACGTNGEMRNIYIYIYGDFGGENLKERGYLKDPGINWMILK